MLGKIIKSGVIASIVGMTAFYFFADLIGNQRVLREAYFLSESLWRNPNLLTKNLSSFLKYFSAYILTNTLWSYLYYIRQNTLTGTGIQRGVKFFFLLWLFTIPLHFWSWVMIPYPMQILIYNVFVTNLFSFAAVGIVIGKICTEE